MTTCADGFRDRACYALLETLDVPSFEAEALDIQQTVAIVEGLKAQAELYRNHMFQNGQRPPAPEEAKITYPLLGKIETGPCRKLFDYACPVSCIRRDSGNLPNQKGYVAEYDPTAPFEAQFFERYKNRYSEDWADAKFKLEGLLTIIGKYLVTGVGLLGGMVR